MRNARTLPGVAGFAIALAAVSAEPAAAQWSTVHEQFYLPAAHNWHFRHSYPAADRLFNAFDYGHAILYETLYRYPDAPVSRLEEKQYDFITRKLLVHPPRVPLEEAAIEVAYSKLAPEAKVMFDWAHLLHRQIYDVLADERLSDAEKDAEVAALVRFYRTRPDVAFSTVPKSMEIMDGHSYSTEFRQKYPKFNGLIWGYHWLQVGLYEPLLVGRNLDERQAAVSATVTRFRQMLENPPETMPYLMPMTAAVAPSFAARYPEPAIIFDNLHMMHDVISDILLTQKISRQKKREEILKVAEMFRDRTSYAISEQEWREMSVGMGVHNMGGPAVGFIAQLPEPTVPRGMSMAGMDHANMPGTQRGQVPEIHRGHTPGNRQQPGQQDSAMQHGAVPMDAPGSTMEQMMQMHTRMMTDPVIRERVATDPVLQRMMQRMHQMMSDTSSAHAEHRLPGTADTAAARQAMEFVTLLLADPQIEARVHADPRLHRLWTDPQVQRCLATMRQLKAAGQPLPAACPAPPPGR